MTYRRTALVTLSPSNSKSAAFNPLIYAGLAQAALGVFAGPDAGPGSCFQPEEVFAYGCVTEAIL